MAQAYSEKIIIPRDVNRGRPDNLSISSSEACHHGPSLMAKPATSLL